MTGGLQIGDMEIEVRRARSDDGRAVAEIGHASWNATYAGLMPDALLEHMSVDLRLKRWNAWQAEPDPEARVWLLVRSGTIVGYAATGAPRESPDDDERSNDPGTAAPTKLAEIYACYLHPDCWHSGLGRIIFGHALQDLASRGYEELSLWVLSANQRARKFYERHGFKVDRDNVTKRVFGFPLVHTRYVCKR